MSIERVPPQNVEAEEFLIASLLIDAYAIDQITETHILADDFYDDRHKSIYQAIMALQSENKPVDIITVTESLRILGVLDRAGGAEYVSSLMDKTPSGANAKYYAEIIHSKYLLRQLININTEIISKCFDAQIEPKTILDTAEQKIFEINQNTFTNKFTLINTLVNSAITDIMERVKNKANIELSGVPSGFHVLDEMTDGFQKSEMIIIAARPSMGKTSFALNVATNAAIKNGKRVGFFSCEMSSASIAHRILSAESRVSESKIKKGLLGRQEMEDLVRAAEKIYEMKMVFDDTPNIPLMELKTKARKMKREHEIDILMIDYLGLITINDELGKNTPRHEQIAYVSRSLKSLARELNIPVIVLAQLNRNVETRGEDSEPKLSDLRDSGSIEQDADVIMFIHGYDKKEGNNDETANLNAKARSLIIGKNRNGPTGKVPLVFLKDCTRFESTTKEQYN